MSSWLRSDLIADLPAAFCRDDRAVEQGPLVQLQHHPGQDGLLGHRVVRPGGEQVVQLERQRPGLRISRAAGSTCVAQIGVDADPKQIGRHHGAGRAELDQLAARDELEVAGRQSRRRNLRIQVREIGDQRVSDRMDRAEASHRATPPQPSCTSHSAAGRSPLNHTLITGCSPPAYRAVGGELSGIRHFAQDNRPCDTAHRLSARTVEILTA
jgi:hypothetical protein